MKLTARLIEPVDLKKDFIVVEFYEDKARQHFAVFTSGAYRKHLKMQEVYTMNIKFRSVVMPDVNGDPTYETQLYIQGYPVALSNIPQEWQFTRITGD